MKTFIRRFNMPVCSPGQLAEFTLTTLGILGLTIGLVVLPKLVRTETDFYVGLLALVAFMLEELRRP